MHMNFLNMRKLSQPRTLTDVDGDASHHPLYPPLLTRGSMLEEVRVVWKGSDKMRQCVDTLTASSHREHRQDKTVLSCLRSQCELSSRQSQTVFNVLETEQFALSAVWTHLRTSLDPVSKWRHSRTKLVSKFSVAESCLVFSSVHTANTDKTKTWQSCLVGVRSVN